MMIENNLQNVFCGHTDMNNIPFTPAAAGNWSLLALSKPPNVSARFGSVGEMYASLWCSPTELTLRDKFVPGA
jgi:hypothetical protein